MRASECCFHLVLLARPFTRSLPTGKLQWLTRSNPLKLFFFEMEIGDISGGYFMNKMNDCLMIGSYVCGLNSELFLHTDKKHFFFLLETNIMQKSIWILTLYPFMFSQFLFT